MASERSRKCSRFGLNKWPGNGSDRMGVGAAFSGADSMKSSCFFWVVLPGQADAQRGR